MPFASRSERELESFAVAGRTVWLWAQRRNEGVTEIKKIPNRGHSLTIDSGWREVADTALAFVKRFV